MINNEGFAEVELANEALGETSQDGVTELVPRLETHSLRLRKTQGIGRKGSVALGFAVLCIIALVGRMALMHKPSSMVLI